MNTIYILIMLLANSEDRVGTQYIERYTTSTACERAVAVLNQGVERDRQQKKIFVCVPYEAGK